MAHHEQQEQQHQPEDISGLANGVASIAVTTEASAASAPDSEVCAKGPKRSEQANKSEQRLRQPVVTTPSGAGAAAQISAATVASMGFLAQQQQQQPGYIASPITPTSDQAWMSQPLQQHQSPNFEDNFLMELLGPVDCQIGGGGIPHQMQPQVPPLLQPQPLPLPLPQPRQPSEPASTPVHAHAAMSSPPTPGAVAARPAGPVSEATRLALIEKLRPAGPQTPLVDDNFNTPLHHAILQQKTKDHVDYLLSDLKNQKKLQPLINLINSCGQTPLSLCLKMRRPDLIPMLLAFDAAPTQLCGSVSERNNHFHYAMAKCVDSTQSLQLACVLFHSVCKHCQLDLSGMLAKNRHSKTAMDFLRHRILACQGDPASAELLNSLQSLFTWLSKQLGVSS